MRGDGRRRLGIARQPAAAPSGSHVDDVLRFDASRSDSAAERPPAAAAGEPSYDAWCRAFVEGASDAIIGLTVAGTVTSWNAGAERLYGYTAAEMVGQPVAPIVPADRYNEARKVYRVLQSGLRIEKLHTVRVRKDGRSIDVVLTLAPMLDAHGRMCGASCVARDAAPQDEEEQRLTAVRADLESRIVASAAQLRAANIELQKQIRARERLAGRLLTLQDEERRRLGRELHDSTAQNLVALDMNLARLSRAIAGRPELEGTMADSRVLVEESLREIRTLSYLLHPPLLDEAGLTSAVRWYADGFAQRSGIAVSVEIDPTFGRLAREAETALFRITQESLTNVHRHAASPTVSIRLKRRPTAVILEVVDKGHGMTAEHLVDTGRKSFELGVGISGMRERVRRLGGQLIITSSTEGTSVRATLPLLRNGSIPVLARRKPGHQDQEVVSRAG